MVLEEAGLKGITKTFGEVEKTMNEAGLSAAAPGIIPKPVLI